MATSFGDLKAAIVRLLGDSVETIDNVIASSNAEPELLRNAVHAGLLAMLPYVWKSATYTILDNTTVLTLPEDLYHVEAIYDNYQEAYLEESILTPGIPTASESGNMWVEYPEGSMFIDLRV